MNTERNRSAFRILGMVGGKRTCHRWSQSENNRRTRSRAQSGDKYIFRLKPCQALNIETGTRNPESRAE